MGFMEPVQFSVWLFIQLLTSKKLSTTVSVVPSRASSFMAQIVGVNASMHAEQ